MQIGLLGVLTAVFVVLKLTGLIAWSWLWVFSPIWLAWGVSFAILIAFVCLAFLAIIFNRRL